MAALTCASRSVFWVPGMGRPNCKLGSRLSRPPTLPRFMGARSTCRPDIRAMGGEKEGRENSTG